MTNKSFARAFTLIELLVVIAIIGILSAVVLAALSQSRLKGQDAAVESNLKTIETQADAFYNGAGGSTYGPDANGCTAAGSMFVLDTTIANAIISANNKNPIVSATCNAAAGPPPPTPCRPRSRARPTQRRFTSALIRPATPRPPPPRSAPTPLVRSTSLFTLSPTLDVS